MVHYAIRNTMRQASSSLLVSPAQGSDLPVLNELYCLMQQLPPTRHAPSPCYLKYAGNTILFFFFCTITERQDGSPGSVRQRSTIPRRTAAGAANLEKCR